MTTSIGASTGWPSSRPSAMSKVRRPLIMAPQSLIHSSMTTLSASGSLSYWPTWFSGTHPGEHHLAAPAEGECRPVVRAGEKRVHQLRPVRPLKLFVLLGWR